MEQVMDTPTANVIVVLLLTALAFLLRFYKIGHPDQVVYVVFGMHHVQASS
jgi:dolichyl-phosphate-mannose--protein O-mannosyl transferase